VGGDQNTCVNFLFNGGNRDSSTPYHFLLYAMSLLLFEFVAAIQVHHLIQVGSAGVSPCQWLPTVMLLLTMDAGDFH
jgi:hypothetical protein